MLFFAVREQMTEQPGDDETVGATEQLTEHLRKSPFPPAECPLFYADGVIAISRSGGAVKFYLMRYDPNVLADGTNNPQYVAQIVMPAAGFAAAVVLFDSQLQEMIDKAEIKREFVEQQRKFYVKSPDDHAR
jgi:hypothetical protein